VVGHRARRAGPVAAIDLVVRRSSRLIVDGLRRRSAAIARTRPRRGKAQSALAQRTTDTCPADHAHGEDGPPLAITASALLAVRASRHRRVADELATLQLSPEHLHVLRDHVISEPDDQHLHASQVLRSPGEPKVGHRDGSTSSAGGPPQFESPTSPHSRIPDTHSMECYAVERIYIPFEVAIKPPAWRPEEGARDRRIGRGGWSCCLF
jgi:hypothetical protein